MKFMLVTCCMVFTTVGFGQSYKYDFAVRSNDSYKITMSNITSGIFNKNRLITEDTMTFTTQLNLSFNQFDSICRSYGYDSIYFFNKSKSDIRFDIEKAGNTDCAGAVQVCSNASFNGNSSNNSFQDLTTANSGCVQSGSSVFVESSPNWYYINIATGGSLELTLNPTANNADIDFAIWGPFNTTNVASNCPPVSPPLRLGVASPVHTGTGLTGMSPCSPGGGSGCSAQFHTSSNYAGCPTGNGDTYVAPINANAGDIYILLINNYSNVGNYTLNWGGSAVLGCTPVVLSVELSSFEAHYATSNVLEWETISERDNSHFTLERSTDGISWNFVAKIEGFGTTDAKQEYAYNDYLFEEGVINYYRLKQTDFSGNSEFLGVRHVDNSRDARKTIIGTYDLLGKEIDRNFTNQWIINVYDDGSSSKHYTFE